MREIVSDPVRVYLAPAEYIDSDHPAIQAEALRLAPPGASPAERARALFYAVREIRYGYVDHTDLETCRASSVLAAKYGYCVGKASLMSALCRAAGIPARIGFADVTNHLATPRMLETMGTNVFAWHGYSEILIGDRWLRVSPTFNASLCDKFGVRPLEFDGMSDALLQAYDRLRPLSAAEREALPLLCRGAALRFLLTRLVDWLDVPPGALVRPKDPLEYFRKLRFHQAVASVRDYGIDGVRETA